MMWICRANRIMDEGNICATYIGRLFLARKAIGQLQDPTGTKVGDKYAHVK